MNNEFYLFMGIAAILIVLFIILSTIGGNKKYKVTMANNEVLELNRKWSDSWNDSKEMKMYHKDGKRVILSTHWIIKSEEIDGGKDKQS